MIATATTVAAVALTRWPGAKSVTQRSAVISFRTAAPAHASVTLRDGARVDAGAGVEHVARLAGLTPGRRYAYRVETGSAGCQRECDVADRSDQPEDPAEHQDLHELRSAGGVKGLREEPHKKKTTIFGFPSPTNNPLRTEREAARPLHRSTDELAHAVSRGLCVHFGCKPVASAGAPEHELAPAVP